MERVRSAEAATATVAAASALVVLLLVAGLGSLGRAPVEAFHLAALGLVVLGTLVAALGEIAAA